MGNSNGIRTISDDFLTSLECGELSGLTKLVRNSKNELVMCFRDGYINVYYKSHSVFKITEQEKAYKTEFNLGHARYTKNPHLLPEVKKCDIKFGRNKVGLDMILNGKIKGKAGNTDNTVWFNVPKNGKVFDFGDITGIFKKFIGDFFDTALNYDYFDKKKKAKKGLLEKIRQQEIFTGKYTCPDGDYTFYDIELSIPNNVSAGSPDCLAVKTENGVITKIALAEVKSEYNSCNGEHGVEKHINDSEKLITNEGDQLIAAMNEQLKYYKKLNLKTVGVNKTSENIDFEILLIFTDDAKKWTKNDRQENKNYIAYTTAVKNKEIKEWQI